VSKGGFLGGSVCTIVQVDCLWEEEVGDWDWWTGLHRTSVYLHGHLLECIIDFAI